MSQKKVYLFSPDGKSEGWFMEDDAPAGWLTSSPDVKEDEGDQAKPDELSDEPDNGELSPQEVPESETPPQVADEVQPDYESTR